MAKSRFHTVQYTADQFVESVGAVPIKVSTREICLIWHRDSCEWLLAKGRRNVGETRHDAALREVAEETGYRCSLLPLNMITRAPSSNESGYCPDEARAHSIVCEPFIMTNRKLEGEMNLKIIWWYIAAIDEQSELDSGEEHFKAQLVSFEEAVKRLTFDTDRDIVRKAVEIFNFTYRV